MRTRRFGLVFCVVVALALAPTLAQAAVFTGTDQGVDISLEEMIVDSTLNLWLTLSTSEYNGPGDYLHGISVKATNQLEASDITVVDPPNPDADWTTSLGHITNNTTGPDGNVLGSGEGWFSTIYTASNFGIGVPDSSFSFHYAIDITGLSVLSDPSVKIIYVDDQGYKANGLTSTTLAPVPEPGTLLLLGSGLVSMGATARRRSRRK